MIKLIAYIILLYDIAILIRQLMFWKSKLAGRDRVGTRNVQGCCLFFRIVMFFYSSNNVTILQTFLQDGTNKDKLIR